MLDSPPAAPVAPPSPTILVVDDEPMVTVVCQAALSELGYQVLVAESGAAAIELWKNHPVHLLITDVFMDHINGPELARILTLHQPSLKVIFMSGAPRENLAGLLPPGANLMSKPTSLAGLRDRVAKVLAG
jgi:CheY-like chemotaxis protein